MKGVDGRVLTEMNEVWDSLKQHFLGWLNVCAAVVLTAASIEGEDFRGSLSDLHKI